MLNLITFLSGMDSITESFQSFKDKIIPGEPISIIIQLTATLVIFLCVGKFVFKPVRNILAKRAEHVESQILDAEKEKNNAQIYVLEAKTNVDEAKIEARRIIKEAKEQTVILQEEAQLALEKELALRRKQCEEEINQAKIQAEEEVRKEIIEVALQASEVILNREVNKEDNSRLIENFVKDVNN